jgi:hypothetical protein
MPNFPHDTLARAKVEAAEKWRDIKIPPLRFPEGWVIELVPPFAGAVARFVATNTHGVKVSVYYDAHGALGAEDHPYWEIYPVGGDLTVADEDDTRRFASNEQGTAMMIECIGRMGDPVRGAIVGLTGKVDE